MVQTFKDYWQSVENDPHSRKLYSASIICENVEHMQITTNEYLQLIVQELEDLGIHGRLWQHLFHSSIVKAGVLHRVHDTFSQMAHSWR